LGFGANGTLANAATQQAIKAHRGLDRQEIEPDLRRMRTTNANLLKHIKEKQSVMRNNHTTISASVVDEMFKANNDIEYRRLKELAEGCPQTPHPMFNPNGGEQVRERTITEYECMKEMIMIHSADEFRKGQSIIIGLAEAVKMCKAESLTLHVSEMFMREKQDNPLGRLIPDYSFNRFGTPMSGEDQKPILAELWGQIKHPTVGSLCRAMLSAKQNANGMKVVGARTDIKAAYTRIPIKANEATMMAKLIMMDGPNQMGPVIAIPISNQWGSQVAGYAFDVITRALRERAYSRNSNLWIQVLIYVDDHIVFGTEKQVDDEVNAFMKDVRVLLGHDAIQESKNIRGTRIDAIGWRCDTNDWTVAPSARAIIKLVNVFINELPNMLTSETKVTVKQLMRMSSYAIRYSAAILPMRPYTTSFAINIRGHHGGVMAKRRLLNRTRADIEMWRTLMCMMFNDATIIKVPIEWPIIEAHNENGDCTEKGADIVIYTDAQKTHGGIGVYIPNVTWIGVDIHSTHYTVSDVNKEIDINIYEYIAVIIGFFYAIKMLNRDNLSNVEGYMRNKRIHVHTDNTSCISWVQKRRSESPTHAVLMQLTTMLQIEYGCLLTLSHIPGVLNIEADAISRRFQVPNGLNIRERVQILPREKMNLPLLRSLEDALNLRDASLFTVGLAARTALERATGCVSRTSTEVL